MVRLITIVRRFEEFEAIPQRCQGSLITSKAKYDSILIGRRHDAVKREEQCHQAIEKALQHSAQWIFYSRILCPGLITLRTPILNTLTFFLYWS
ncbi:hypothetical protein ElyMa_005885200 [Elysia marginata]|uniref:Uncharacterized protein n=1 Tax=Elysia marginata TaxID=1093978 RepID=A0AAV4G2U6_9GAST|nr:hypothetical protein ElyMa_005885200 [Elysia marginata]